MKALMGIPFSNLPYENLQFVGVLLFNIYPSTVIYRDTNKCIVKEWVDCTTDNLVNRFFYYEVSEGCLKRFIDGEISHLDFINSAVESYVYFQDEVKENNSIKKTNTFLLSIKNIPSNYLPNSDFLFDKKDGIDTDEIIKAFGNDIHL